MKEKKDKSLTLRKQNLTKYIFQINVRSFSAPFVACLDCISTFV